MKTKKVLTKVIALSLVTVSILYATHFNINTIFTPVTYNDMSTIKLQEEVEELSQDGDLPFDMGLELMERWTQKS